MRNLYILGVTGSIGLQTIDVIKQHKAFHLIGVSLGSDHQKNASVLDAFDVEIASLRDEKQLTFYKNKYPKTTFVYGDQGLIDVASYPKKGLLVNALSGSSGLKPTIAAITSKKDIALANKETLVMAGPIIKELIKLHDVKLLPIDSEHSAIWQLIDHEDTKDIEKIVITASGGAFRDQKREALDGVSIKEALSHPNWQMGAKITIDSATMMNKGLEIIEAHHLFDLPYDQIDTILHKESICHGMIYFKDGSIKASLGASDMRIPISYALGYPERMHLNQIPIKLETLHFEPMDFKRFPLLKLAYQVGMAGGIMPTVMHAANQVAVELFLANKISFLEIEDIVIKTVRAHQQIISPTIDDIIQTDAFIQSSIRNTFEKR